MIENDENLTPAELEQLRAREADKAGPRTSKIVQLSPRSIKILAEHLPIWKNEGKIIDMALRDWENRHAAARAHRDGHGIEGDDEHQ